MKPLRITQPEGASFSVKNHVLAWQNWEVCIGFNGREGLTLHDVSFNDHGVKCPMFSRAAVSEKMVVPYGEPQPPHEWQNYFDAGEYQLGRPSCSDATALARSKDFGTPWKHPDVFTNAGTVRRQRRLVISFFVTVGNYDTGFYCYLYLDVAIDGSKCHVDELQVQRLPISPVGNAFKCVATRLERESDAQREVHNKLGCAWLVASSDKLNRLGNPTAYYARDEMWAVGYTSNQYPGYSGLPVYAKANRSVGSEDIVLWHTFGLTHFPRAEDLPIMPEVYAGSFKYRVSYSVNV
ncbi:actin binding protein [Phytophthora pseudosyringae]|uniref:Amine oxidase n=1 Tax=Phytophthora pseudosyringae TaxID=221518 RepID=A0A8T1WFZ8_9STRA|nr:actin binding protein [Phytophthora pseudosyringae]